MIRRLILAVLLCSSLSFGAVAFNIYNTSGYVGSGVNSINLTATGTNLACVMIVGRRSGALSLPTCGGVSMTPVVTALSDGKGATFDAYIAVGMTAGTVAASVSATVESWTMVYIVNGAAQSGQPDAHATVAAGASTYLVAGGEQADIPITTATNASIVLGWFGTNGSFWSATPSTTGTYAGTDGSVAWGDYCWYSTSNAATAGLFTLSAKSASSGLPTFAGIVVSVAPLAPTYVANPSVFGIAP
jgi:hypothetical protein